MRKNIFIFILAVGFTPLFGQVVGLEVGAGNSVSNVDVVTGDASFNKSSGLSVLSPSIYYQKRFPGDFLINVGGRYTRQKWSYQESLAVNSGSDNVDFSFDNIIRSVGLSLGAQKSVYRLKDGSSIYTQLDFQVNFSKNANASFADDFATNTTFNVNSEYAASTYFGLRPEIGIKTKLSGQLELLFFTGYNFGFQDIVTTDYYSESGATTLTDYNISATGSGLMFGVKIQIDKYDEEKENKRREELLARKEEKRKKKLEDKEVPPEEPVKEEPVQEIKVQVNNEGLPATLNDRPVHKNSDVEVKKPELTVKLWDHNQVDGDTISLFVNGKPVLENYCLTKEPKKIDIKLESGKNNYIILYAHNLGTRGKNTAAIAFKDSSGKERVRKLESDLGRCDAINIRTKK